MTPPVRPSQQQSTSERRRSGLRSDRRGSIAAEFALVIPILLLLSFGIIEFGRVMWVRNSLQSAVEDAARCYALNRPECETTDAVKSYAASKTGGVPATEDMFTPSVVACGKQVVATYDFDSFVPVIPLDIEISARACRPAPP